MNAAAPHVRRGPTLVPVRQPVPQPGRLLMFLFACLLVCLAAPAAHATDSATETTPHQFQTVPQAGAQTGMQDAASTTPWPGR